MCTQQFPLLHHEMQVKGTSQMPWVRDQLFRALMESLKTWAVRGVRRCSCQLSCVSRGIDALAVLANGRVGIDGHETKAVGL